MIPRAARRRPSTTIPPAAGFIDVVPEPAHRLPGESARFASRAIQDSFAQVGGCAAAGAAEEVRGPRAHPHTLIAMRAARHTHEGCEESLQTRADGRAPPSASRSPGITSPTSTRSQPRNACPQPHPFIPNKPSAHRARAAATGAGCITPSTLLPSPGAQQRGETATWDRPRAGPRAVPLRQTRPGHRESDLIRPTARVARLVGSRA